MPLATMVCGLLAPLLLIVIEALRTPMPLGANVTLNVHAAPAATLPHVEPLTANSAALLLAIDATVTGALPMLPIVTICGGLIAPMLWSGRLMLAGIDSWPVPGGGAFATPVPVSDIDSDPPPL